MSTRETKWADGPWRLEGSWKPDAVSLGGWLSMGPSGPPLFELNPITGTPAEISANAQLIAAAPELYEALERLVSHWEARAENDPDTFGLNEDGLPQARLAMRKARGEAS